MPLDYQADENCMDAGKVASPPLEIYSDKWGKQLLTWGVETRGCISVMKMLEKEFNLGGLTSTGIRPVAAEERTDTQFNKIFFLWFSANFNILSYVT